MRFLNTKFGCDSYDGLVWLRHLHDQFQCLLAICLFSKGAGSGLSFGVWGFSCAHGSSEFTGSLRFWGF